jgi:hypothetical protein
LIHKGTPVPVPIYVGMELRVEGKTCKTGRTHHNSTKIVAPVSAPPHISSTKTAPIESESHSTSALDNPQGIDPNETISSESTLDKIDDSPYHYHPTDKSNQFSIIRQKRSAKAKSTRITIDTSPVRSKLNTRIQSSKGK